MSDHPVSPTKEPIATAKRHINAIKEYCGSVVFSMHCDKALEALDMAAQPAITTGRWYQATPGADVILCDTEQGTVVVAMTAPGSFLPDGPKLSKEMAQANAKHIVQCVTACSTLPNGALDGGWTVAGLERWGKQIEAENTQLKLAELGAQEAFGTIVEAKKQIEAKSREQQRTIASQQDIIYTMRAAIQANHAWHQNYDEHGGYPESELCTQNKAALQGESPNHILALKSIITAADRVSRYLCGGHYEPRTEDEAAAAADLFRAIEQARQTVPSL